jgi:hypothetical protein
MADPTNLALAALAARTTSDSGSALDAKRGGRSVTAVLTVAAGSGAGTGLVVVVESSETGLGDSEWAEDCRFAVVSGATELVTYTVAAHRYVRARWEISGVTPSFTFRVDARAYSHLITRQQLANHISPTYMRLALDDGNVGTANESAVDGILSYASSMLRGQLGPVDSLDGFNPEEQSEIVRIGLDIAQSRIAQRAPEVLRLDWQPILKAARADLAAIVQAKATTGVPERPPDSSYAPGVASFPRRECLVRWDGES